MKEKIIQILKDRTEDKEIVNGDVVSYVPDWEFEEVAEEIEKLYTIKPKLIKQ